ncbi:hypothetical protein PYCC9005_005345 [Savitreella phatthalungensis]
MSLSLQTVLPLHDGGSIPQLGFGVYESPAKVTRASVTAALEAGYRHIDSAQYYANECEVGEAVRSFVESSDGKVKREDIFVTTKILKSAADGDDDKTLAEIRKSNDAFNLGYIDLFLIHSPSCGPADRKVLWRVLSRAKKEGLVKHIGVSNYGVRHLEEIAGWVKSAEEPDITELPVINQIELHPYLQQPTITQWCANHKIVVEAYCPLTRGERMSHKTLVRVGEETGWSPAQVLLRWSLQRGFVPLPKSDTPSRIVSNADLFGKSPLTEAQMKEIDALEANHAIFHNPVDAE